VRFEDDELCWAGRHVAIIGHGREGIAGDATLETVACPPKAKSPWVDQALAVAIEMQAIGGAREVGGQLDRPDTLPFWAQVGATLTRGMRPGHRDGDGARGEEAEGGTPLGAMGAEAAGGLELVERSAGEDFARLANGAVVPTHALRSAEGISPDGDESEDVTAGAMAIKDEVTVSLPVALEIISIVRRLDPAAVGETELKGGHSGAWKDIG
jgi:hypothetical protein